MSEFRTTNHVNMERLLQSIHSLILRNKCVREANTTYEHGHTHPTNDHFSQTQT